MGPCSHASEGHLYPQDSEQGPSSSRKLPCGRMGLSLLRGCVLGSAFWCMVVTGIRPCVVAWWAQRPWRGAGVAQHP